MISASLARWALLGGGRGTDVAALDPVAEDEKSWEVDEEEKSWEFEDEVSWGVDEVDVVSGPSMLVEADDGFDDEIMMGILTLVVF